MAIRREITVTRKGLNSPIDIVHETNLLPFEFVVTDFAIPSASIAVVYVESSGVEVRKQVCEIRDNTISFTPEASLFVEGINEIQLRVTHEERDLFTHKEIVNCAEKIAKDDVNEANSQPTLVAQLLTKTAESMQKSEDAYQHLVQLSNANLLINGNFQVWQRGTEFNGINSGDTTYTADRWAVYFEDASEVNITKVNKGLSVSISTARSIKIFQPLDIELLNCLSGKTLVLSYGVTNESYTPQYKTYAKQIEVPSYDLDQFHFSLNNLYIELIDGDVLNWAKLEVGEVATPCIPRLYAEELAICKRYFQILCCPLSARVTSVTTTTFAGCIYPVSMRTKPSYYASKLTDVNHMDITDDFSHCLLDSEHITEIETQTPHTSIYGTIILDAEIYADGLG